MRLTIDGRPHDVEVDRANGQVKVDGRVLEGTLEPEGRELVARIGGRSYRVELPQRLDTPMIVTVDGKGYEVVAEGLRHTRPPAGPRPVAPLPPLGVVAGAVTARMAGRILRVDVKPGEQVGTGTVLVILEAMKMENEIVAPHEGTVVEVAVSPGQRVAEGETLVVLG